MPDENRQDAIALLKADHRNVEDLFAEFKAAKGAAKKQALVERICAELSGLYRRRDFLSGLPG